MAYFAPYIDEAGLHIPTYVDIRDYLLAEAKRIFGQDIYLGNDSQDYVYISSIANVLYDSFLTAQLSYENRSPATAIGQALDGLVLINGIQRKKATHSRSAVIIRGSEGTVINKGAVSDINGNRWNLPESVVIPSWGSVTVYATAQEPGPVIPEQITDIQTPTFGWDSVENAKDASFPSSIGTNVESHAALRARQKISTAKPSRTAFEGVVAGVAEVLGVTRYRGYENDTNYTDADTLPPHSIAIVAEGGVDLDLANEIYRRKTPGCYTYGNTEVTIQDVYGEPTVIRFWRPTYIDISVKVYLKALSNYTTATADSIKLNLADYINSVGIGSDLSISALWGAALAANSDMRRPNFSITQVEAGLIGSESTQDIDIVFNEVARSSVADITVIIV